MPEGIEDHRDGSETLFTKDYIESNNAPRRIRKTPNYVVQYRSDERRQFDEAALIRSVFERHLIGDKPEPRLS